MACVGRTKECTIVPSNHYGPIPGIPVGTMWKFRVQVRVNIWSSASGTDLPEAPSLERATLRAGGMAGTKASSSCAVAQTSVLSQACYTQSESQAPGSAAAAGSPEGAICFLVVFTGQ